MIATDSARVAENGLTTVTGQSVFAFASLAEEIRPAIRRMGGDLCTFFIVESSTFSWKNEVGCSDRNTPNDGRPKSRCN